MIKFRNVKLLDQTFDFIGGEYPSFFERCYRLSTRTYRCVDDEAHKRYGVMRVGSINAKVYNVRG